MNPSSCSEKPLLNLEVVRRFFEQLWNWQ